MLPSSTSTVSGTITSSCGGEYTSSGFMSVRGVYGKDTASIDIAGVTVPPTARLVTQERSADLAPLEFCKYRSNHFLDQSNAGMYMY